MSRAGAAVNVSIAVDANAMHAIHTIMTQDSIEQALKRIDTALARIEAASKRKPIAGNDESKYQMLRSRTQAALASLETVIAQAGGRP